MMPRSYHKATLRVNPILMVQLTIHVIFLQMQYLHLIFPPSIHPFTHTEKYTHTYTYIHSYLHTNTKLQCEAQSAFEGNKMPYPHQNWKIARGSVVRGTAQGYFGLQRKVAAPNCNEKLNLHSRRSKCH